MAELLEYCLVFMVSMLFVAGSVATYDSFTRFTTALQFRLASSSISGLVSDAIARGGATGAFAVPPSTVTCEGGLLTFESGGMSQQQRVAASCDFEAVVPGGTHSFGFSYGSRRLNMTVS